MIVGLALHIVLNEVFKVFPPDDPTLAELQKYLVDQAGNWSMIHGLRYVALICMVIFAAGLFARTCRSRLNGWGIVGIMGFTILVTNALMTNGIEMLAFHNDGLVTKDPDMFQNVFRLTRILFTAEVVIWSIPILGFCAASWHSATLPKWIAVLGFVNVAAGLLTGCFIVSVMADGWQSIFAEIAGITGLLWFASTAVYMIMRGDS